MNIAIIDADLIGRKKHRFPNLACMKISGYYKEMGHNVILKLDYNNLHNFDLVYISKVFTDTEIPEEPEDKSQKNTENIIQYYSNNNFLKIKNIKYGGTGFFYDKAPPLPYEIEHHIPDYHLYDLWVQEQLKNKVKLLDLKYYTDYSIGYTTRFCFRGCKFCVNQNYKKVLRWSSLNEFVDKNRPKICLLDDNMFGCKDWKQILLELQKTNKQFQYKQGLDERLLTEEKINLLFSSKYDGDFIFAFDNINDAGLIKNKLELIRSTYKNKGQNIKFYVLCAFDPREKDEDEQIRKQAYSEDFWINDIENTFERIRILMKFNCLPYIMRYEKYIRSPYYGTYVNLASWCNQPNLFKKKSYKEWCIADDERKNKGKSATIRYYNKIVNDYPEIEHKYFELKFDDINQYS